MMNKQPKPWVESMLVAYVDDQLEPAQMAAIEEVLREDAEARAIVGVLRRSVGAVRAAFDQPMNEPVPARLLAAVGAEDGRTDDGQVVPLRRRKMRIDRSRSMLLAASVAGLAIGFGAGYLQFAPGGAIHLAGTPQHEPATGQYEAALYRALEDGRPGASVPYEDSTSGRLGAVTIVGPVTTASGSSCREFRHEWTDATGMETGHGLACRFDSGDWSILELPPKPAS